MHLRHSWLWYAITKFFHCWVKTASANYLQYYRRPISCRQYFVMQRHSLENYLRHETVTLSQKAIGFSSAGTPNNTNPTDTVIIGSLPVYCPYNQLVCTKGYRYTCGIIVPQVMIGNSINCIRPLEYIVMSAQSFCFI